MSTRKRMLRRVALGVALSCAVLIGGVGVWTKATAQIITPQPALTFTSSTYTVGEADGTVTLTVTLSESSSETVTVDYASSDGTANSTGLVDYIAVSGTLIFTSGQTSKTIVVTIIDDDCCESNETFTVTLSNPTNATIGTPGTTTVTITDDDTGC